METSYRIFHGCFTKNKDGTNRIIEKGKTCLFSTNNPFWKYPEDTPSCVKTRSQEKKSKTSRKDENTIHIFGKKIEKIFGDD